MDTPESQGNRQPCGFPSAPCFGMGRFREEDKRITCSCPDGMGLPSGILAKDCPYKGKTQSEMREKSDARDLGDFWKVQAQLAQTLQLDIARTLNAKRLHGEPTATKELQEMAQALVRLNEIYDMAQWRLSGNERADV